MVQYTAQMNTKDLKNSEYCNALHGSLRDILASQDCVQQMKWKMLDSRLGWWFSLYLSTDFFFFALALVNFFSLLLYSISRQSVLSCVRNDLGLCSEETVKFDG